MRTDSTPRELSTVGLMDEAEDFEEEDFEEEEHGSHTNGESLEKGETSPLKTSVPAKVTLPLTGTKWDDYNLMNSWKLLMQPLRGGLDKYARYNCMLVGASKIPGGKMQLVPAIIKARGYNDPSGAKAPPHIFKKSK